MADRMARPLKGDIKIMVNDGDTVVTIHVERERINPRHRKLAADVLKLIEKHFKEPRWPVPTEGQHG
jgi:hypothetical protein